MCCSSDLTPGTTADQPLCPGRSCPIVQSGFQSSIIEFGHCRASGAASGMQKIAILYDASQAVLSTLDLDEVLKQILMIARDYFHLQNVAILLLDKETDELYPRSQIGWDQGHETVRLSRGAGITGAAARLKRPLYVPDVSKDARYICSATRTRSELAVPLMVRDEVVGVLDCQSENLNHFDSET